MTQWRSTLLRRHGPATRRGHPHHRRLVEANLPDRRRRGAAFGTVTDGDVRRAILNAIPLDAPVERDEPRAHDLAAGARPRPSDATGCEAASSPPVVDADRRVVGLVLIDDLMQEGR